MNDIERRECFHFCFLEDLLKLTSSDLYVLKGGVNLRFFFNSPRYSEDMDLDVTSVSVSTLKKNGYKILTDQRFKRKLSTFGIEEVIVNDPNRAKHTQTTQRFKCRLITEAGESLPTKVEFSRRSAKSPNDLHASELVDSEIARAYKRLAFYCQHYTGETALIQKIEALAHRPGPQARDVFDMSILILSGFGQPELINQLPQQTLKKAQENLNALEYADFEGQVLFFLNDDHRRVYSTPNIWSRLKSQVNELLSV